MCRRTSRFAAIAGGMVAASLVIATACTKETPAIHPDSAQSKDRPTTTRMIPGPAGSLHVIDVGEGGTPVLFVHGFAGNADQWSAQLAHLGGSRRAIAIDLRGHGQSADPAAEDYSINALAADIGAVADSLKLPKLVLVGHSLGGAGAIEYAGAHPERVAGLVLVFTPGSVPAARAGRIVAAMEADYDKVSGEYWDRLLEGARPEVRARVLADRARVPREPALELIRATMRYDPLPALRRYSGPTLVIGKTREDLPHDLPALVPDLPKKIITGTSHWPQLDNPVEVNRLLDEFLATVP